MEKKQGVWSVFLLCSVGILGVGLFSLPTAATHFGATFYWGYILLGMVFALLCVLLFSLLGEEKIAEQCRVRFRRFGTVFGILYVTFYTAITAFLLAYYAHTVEAWFLDGAPRVMIALFLILVCLFSAVKTTENIVRQVSVVSVFVLLAVIVMRLLMLFLGDVRNLLPMWETVQMRQISDGAVFVSGFFVLIGFLGSIKAPRRSKLLGGGGAVVVSALVLILATAGTVSVIGPLQTARNLDSTVLAMKSLNLSRLDLLQRGDIVFILTWSFLILSAGTMSAHIPYRNLQSLFPAWKPGWMFAVFFLIYAGVALTVPSEEGALLGLIYTAVFGGSIVLLAVPAVLFLVNRRGGK